MPRPKVFISYNSRDRTAVEQVARKLLQNEACDVWLDIWKLRPGDDWMVGLQDGLRESDCCAIFFGPTGTGPWQNQEIRTSLSRAVTPQGGSFRVIPVLLPGGSRNTQEDVPDFLKLKVWVEFRRSIDEDEPFKRLTWGISGQGVPLNLKTSLEGRNPYRGLQAFDVGDTDVFFGRDELVEQLFARLQAMLKASSSRKLLVLIGNSGCGKSSLARAGLIGALQRGLFPEAGSSQWPVAIFKPGANPIENAALALAALPGAKSDARGLRDALSSGNQELNFFVKQLLHGNSPGSRAVMLIDQFEECFTNCEDSALREKFFGNLLYAVEAADGQLLTVVTLRADFFNECLHNPALGAVVSDCLFPVQPMSSNELQEAIERPAQAAGVTLEPGLVDLLLSDVLDESSCLPLMEFALSELWRVSKPRITLEAYNSIGRIGGALAGKAEEVFNSLAPTEQEICHHLFLRLVRRTERARYSSHRVAVTELVTSRASPLQVRRLLQTLTGEGSRLLTVETGTSLAKAPAGTKKNESEKDTVGLAHEVLIQSWPRFRDWLREDSEFQLWYERLSISLDQWRKENRKSEALLRGRLLDEACGWQRRNQPDLNADENEFINQSRAFQNRERLVDWGLLATVVVLSGLLLYIWINKTRVASRQAQQLYAQALASISKNFDDSEIVRPLLIAIYALQTSENPETLEALQDAVQRAGGPITERGGVLKAVSATRDGKLLAAAWDDGSIELLEPRPGAPNGADPAHVYRKVGDVLTAQGNVSALAISQDGSRLAAAGNQPAITIWDLPARNLSSLAVAKGSIKSLDFSASTKDLLIASWEGSVMIQSAGQSNGVRALQNSEHPWQAVFCPSRPCVGMALASGTLGIEDLTSSSQRRLSQGTDAVKSVAFSPDGEKVAIGDAAGAVKILALGAGKDLMHFSEDSGVDRILFSPAGDYVVTMNSGGTASVWVTSTGEQRMKLRTKDGFRSAAFARFGDAPHVAFGTSSGKLLIYDLEPRHLRMRAYEVWLANGKPTLSSADCTRYLHQKSCPTLEWKP